jgi:hypothetical protein
VKTCVDLQIDAATDMYEVHGAYMDKSGHRLEVLWEGVFRGIIEARTSDRKSTSCSSASCFGCRGCQELSLREARTLILSISWMGILTLKSRITSKM